MVPQYDSVQSVTDIENESTVALVQRVQNGDQVALNVIARRLFPRLQRWAAGRLPAWARDLAETQDLVQETLADVLRRLDRFELRHEAALTVYLREALANRLRKEIRRVGRQPKSEPIEIVEHVATPDGSPFDVAVTRQEMERYDAALAALDSDDREAIVARLELHYTYQELAEAWGKPSPDAARKTVERAISRLVQKMKHEA